MTTGDLTTAAQRISPLAAAHAAHADVTGQLHPDVVAGLVSAGFARHFVPTQVGGVAGTFTDALSAAATVGAQCTSAGWIASLMAGVGRMAAYLPQDGQAAVWEKGPDTVVAGALMAAGTATEVTGGYRLNGRWSYVSGIDLAEWTLVCARLGGPGPDPQPWFFAVPRSLYRVEPTWDNVGMRATGSHSLEVEDAFVPAAHAFPLARLLSGRPGTHGAPCHAVPMRAVNGLTLVGPMLGAARGALRAWTALLDAKLSGGVSGAVSGPIDSSHYEGILARTAAEIDGAGLMLTRVAAVADRNSIEEASPLAFARAPRDCAFAAQSLAAAVDRLFRSAGSRGQFAHGVLARLWRDVHSAAGHSGLQPAASAQAFVTAYRAEITG